MYLLLSSYFGGREYGDTKALQIMSTSLSTGPVYSVGGLTIYMIVSCKQEYSVILCVLCDQFQW